MFALLFLLITLMVQTGVSGDNISEGWHKHGNKWVLYVGNPRSHGDAQADCEKMGANLVSVHSANDYKWLQKLIKLLTNAFGETWIGAVDVKQNNKWTWVDGSKFDYSFWCAGEPNNRGTQNCIQMNHSKNKCWDNLGCRHRRPYLCAK